MAVHVQRAAAGPACVCELRGSFLPAVNDDSSLGHPGGSRRVDVKQAF